MNDPFRPDSNPQLMKEARVGLTLLAVTLGLFCYVAYYKISGSGTQLPDHVISAPIASAVWPGENPAQLAKTQPAPKPAPVAHQFGSLLASAKNSLGINANRTPKKQLFEKPKDYTDPLPKRAAERLPVAATPERAVPANYEIADVEKAAADRNVDNSFVANFDRDSEPLKLPIDTNDLRGSSNIASTKTRNGAARRRPTEFQPQHLSPSDTTRFANNTSPAVEDLATRLDDSSEFAPRGPKPVDLDNQFAIEPETRMRESQQLVTADIATELSNESTISDRPNAIEAFASQASLPLRETQNTKATFETEPTGKTETVNSIAQSIEVVDTDAEQSDEHTVLAGESFWSIAQQRYDDGRFFRALFEYNRKRVGTFENLAPGAVIATPAATELAKLWPDLCPKPDGSAAVTTDVNERVYVTREGDTLFEIARQKLDQASRYLEIMEMNQFSLPRGVNHLSPLAGGTRIVLPMSSD